MSTDAVHLNVGSNLKAQPARLPSGGNGPLAIVSMIVLIIVTAVSFGTLALVVDIKDNVDTLQATEAAGINQAVTIHNEVETVKEMVEVAMADEATIRLGDNPCQGKKPYHSDAAGTDGYFNNVDCLVDGVLNTLEQAGANITAGYKGDIDASGRTPLLEPYWKAGLCPVNVHWHLGAEHLSVGEFDEHGSGPSDHHDRKLLAGEVREGFQCHYYDETDEKFTKEYSWAHCEGMHVGNTYEIHWPHSAAGACGTPNQYQTPFYDGVFCTDGIISLDPLNTFEKIGVQGQVFTIVNDEKYYYPDLIRGMIVDGDYGKDIGYYTGSTTGTSRNNEVCSRYTPITWQVDRKCHLISASSFDKMCADMKAQRDDMTDDLYAHGARELVADHLAADNLQK